MKKIFLVFFVLLISLPVLVLAKDKAARISSEDIRNNCKEAVKKFDKTKNMKNYLSTACSARIEGFIYGQFSFSYPLELLIKSDKNKENPSLYESLEKILNENICFPKEYIKNTQYLYLIGKDIASLDDKYVVDTPNLVRTYPPTLHIIDTLYNCKKGLITKKEK